MYVCVSECTAHIDAMPVETRAGVGSPGVGVTGGCELPVVSAKKKTCTCS